MKASNWSVIQVVWFQIFKLNFLKMVDQLSKKGNMELSDDDETILERISQTPRTDTLPFIIKVECL